MQDTQTIQRKNIAALKANARVDGAYAIVNPQLGTTRGGKPFLKCLLRDASGECPARQWTFDDAVNSIASTGFVWIAGHTQIYNDHIQIILEDIRSIEVDEDQLRDLIPCTRFDIDEMMTELCALLKTIEHPGMRTLADAYLGDDALISRFRKAPAAMNLHHAWIGGLLEHTLQMMKLADRMLPLYPQLNRDIVLIGVFIHDLAKTAELKYDRSFEYTTTGNLLGHIMIGCMMLEHKLAEAKRAGATIPASARLVLHHIILSHHGRPEYGALKFPATPEAIFISLLDNLDARTAMAIANGRPPEENEATRHLGEFSEKIWALETRLYRPDPLPTDDTQP